MRVVDIITEEQGRYEWGVRDCLTTAARIVEARTGRPPAIKSWRSAREATAIRRALRAHGSTAAAHTAVLGGLGFRRMGRGADLEPGDILTLEPPVMFMEGPAWPLNDCHLLGFVAETYEVYTWTTRGLRPCGPNIAEVHRCPR